MARSRAHSSRACRGGPPNWIRRLCALALLLCVGSTAVLAGQPRLAVRPAPALEFIQVPPTFNPCTSLLARQRPVGAFRLGSPRSKPFIEPGVIHPGLRNELVAAAIDLIPMPTGPGPQAYRLEVDVVSALDLRDVELSLRMPAGPTVTAHDGQLVLRKKLPGYLAATPGVDYADYRVGIDEHVSGPGMQRFRFTVSGLPPLGQIEATVRGRAEGMRSNTGSYARFGFGTGQRGNGTVVLIGSHGPLQDVAHAQVFAACPGPLAPANEAFRRYRALNSGGATFRGELRATGQSNLDYCVEGRLEFGDIAGAVHPVPGALVELVEGPLGLPSGTLASGRTDSNGYFKLEFDGSGSTPLPGLDLRFSTLGRAARLYREELHHPVADTPNWSLDYSASAGATEPLQNKLVQGSCVDIGWVVADPQSHQHNNYAFEVYTALETGQSAINAVVKDPNTGAEPQLHAVFPNPLSGGMLQGVSLFRKDDGNGVPSVLVASLDVHNWDILLHEVSHFAHHNLQFPAPPGAAHSVYQNHCDIRPKLHAILFGWYESWPTAMGMATQKQLPANLDGTPTLKDGSYTRLDLDGVPLFEVAFEPGQNPLPGYAGEATEFSIISALWETFDLASYSASYNPPLAAQAISTDYQKWVQETGASGIWNFSEFTSHVLPELSNTDANDPRIGGLLARHRVAPMFEPGAGNEVVERLRSRWLFSLRQGPNCDANTPDYPVKYRLRVYSEDYQQVLWESARSDSRVLSAPVGELRNFLTGSGRVMHWIPIAHHPCKKAGNSCALFDLSNPSTGDYPGAGWTMTDDRAVCPDWLPWLLMALLLLGIVLLVLALSGGLKPLLLLLAIVALAAFAWLLYWYWYCLFG